MKFYLLMFTCIVSFSLEAQIPIVYHDTAQAKSGNTLRTALTAEAVNLLSSWHQLDPLSKKDVEHNNAFYSLQSCRNPFVDYPLFKDCCGVQDFTPTLINETVIPRMYELSADNLAVKGSQFYENLDVYTILGEQIMNKTDVESVSLQRLKLGVYIMNMQVNQSPQSLKYLKN